MIVSQDIDTQLLLWILSKMRQADR
jgi:hypothetical protein